MKKIFFKILLFTCAVLMPVSATAGVSVHVDIPFPPPIIFPVPPLPVVIPETNVYVVPDIQEDIFFYGGWWWRPWKDAGTVHGITTRAGFITEAYPLFTDTFRPAGGRVIESANGKDILGSSTASIIKICKETGADGKKTNIGKRKITGG